MKYPNLYILSIILVVTLEISFAKSYRSEGSFGGIVFEAEDYEDEATKIDKYKREMCKNIPADDDIEDYRYDREFRRCSLVTKGHQGHCGSNMLFYPEDYSLVYGLCECRDRDQRGIFIFHKITSQCYQIYTQAYCPCGQWLTLAQPSGEPICKDNPCHQNISSLALGQSQESLDFVELNGTCVRLGHGADTCQENEIVRFERDKILPRCTPLKQKLNLEDKNSVFKLTNTLPPCAPGTFRSLSDKCQKKWEW